MAGAMFLKIDGIDGESTFKGHEKQIDVTSWSWGVSQPTASMSARTASGFGAATANVSDVSFTHSIDRASPNLFQYAFLGKHIPTALLTQRKAGGDESLPFLKVKMTDVFITSVSLGAAGDAGEGQESVSLKFNKVEFEYQEQDEKGKAKGGPVKSAFDIKANAKG